MQQHIIDVNNLEILEKKFINMKNRAFEYIEDRHGILNGTRRLLKIKTSDTMTATREYTIQVTMKLFYSRKNFRSTQKEGAALRIRWLYGGTNYRRMVEC